MSFNRDFNYEFYDRMGRGNYYNSRRPRFRPNFRGRGHQNRFRGRNRGFCHQNSGSHFSQHYRQLVNDFGHQSIDPSMNPTKEKPKYETIVVELGEHSKQLPEQKLRDHFQKTYGTIKKIWFNSNESKAFVSFFNYMSADMCIESGNYVTIDGISLKVYSLEVDIPKELMSTSGDQSFKLKTLCKSNNRGLIAAFPSKRESNQSLQPNISRKQLLDLIKIEKIDEKELLDKLLSANDIEQQMDVLFNKLLLTESEVNKRNQLKDYLQEVLNSNGFECRLHFIGSTVNGLGFRDSDIDIFIETFDGKQKTFDEYMDSLKTVHKILNRTLKMFIPKPIPSTRCPIVKLNFNEWSVIKESGFEALVCDMSLSNALAKRNSALIRLYCRLEPRFEQLCLLLRFWSKLNGFVGSNHMSSYAFTHLVLFYFQNQKQLPSLDRLRQLSPESEPLIINGWNSGFNEDTDSYSDYQKNSDSILELLKQFFQFYANFDFSFQILCTKTGLTKHKSEVWSQIKANCDEEVFEGMPKPMFKLTPIISIEDPFELTHNLCANFSYKTFDKFCEYFKHICCHFIQIFGVKSEENPQKFDEKPKQIENNFWGLSPLCREWDPTQNIYVFPENFIGFANLELILDSEKSPTDLIQLMANRLIDLTNNWLSNVYRIECLLLSKWHLICGQLSPFAEFYIKIRPLDNHVINGNTRLEFRQQFTEEELKNLSFTESETEITDRIHRKFNCDLQNSDVVPISCQFALVMNCRLTFPTVELALIDLKPGFESSKAVINFLRRLIVGAANDSRLLTCPKELLS